MKIQRAVIHLTAGLACLAAASLPVQANEAALTKIIVADAKTTHHLNLYVA